MGNARRHRHRQPTHRAFDKAALVLQSRDMKPPRQISPSEATAGAVVSRRSTLKLLGGALALPLLAGTTTRAAEKGLVWKTAIGLNGF